MSLLPLIRQFVRQIIADQQLTVIRSATGAQLDALRNELGFDGDVYAAASRAEEKMFTRSIRQKAWCCLDSEEQLALAIAHIPLLPWEHEQWGIPRTKMAPVLRANLIRDQSPGELPHYRTRMGEDVRDDLIVVRVGGHLEWREARNFQLHEGEEQADDEYAMVEAPHPAYPSMAQQCERIGWTRTQLARRRENANWKLGRNEHFLIWARG